MTAHARRTDPTSSHLTVRSIAKDQTLAQNIIASVRFQSRSSGKHAVTDDHVWFDLENILARRFQRNVIARARGLLEQDGWFERVPDVISSSTGRPVIAYIYKEPAWLHSPASSEPVSDEQPTLFP